MKYSYNYIFYNPFLKIGGVSILFIRIAKLLLKKGERVFFIDMKNGYLMRNKIKGAKYINYDKPFKIPNNSVLFLQTIPYWRIYQLSHFPDDLKIINYNLHPNNLSYNLVSTHSRYIFLKPLKKVINQLSFLRKKKLKKFLEIIYKKKGIIFEDEFNFSKTNKYYDTNYKKADYLPIFIDNKNKKINFNKIKDKNNIKLVWLGRLDDFKISIIKKIYHSLKEINQLKFDVTIIGNGNYLDYMKNFSKDFDFKTIFMGEINNDKLNNTLRKFDICFAMYTSALESSRLGIPTICVDYSYEDIKKFYKFKLIYMKKNYTLSKEIEFKEISNKNNLPQLLKYIIQNYQDVSKLCYNHWKDKHSEKNIYEKIVKYANDTNLKISDYKNFNHQNKPDIFTKLLNLIRKNQKNNHGFLY